MILTKEMLADYRTFDDLRAGEIDLLDTIDAQAAQHAEELANLKMHQDNAIAAEKRDALKALEALAGWYCTPQEGYGFNTSWAISDLCKAIKQLRAELKATEAAALEMAAKITHEWFDPNHRCVEHHLEKAIRASIPPESATALSRALDEARREEAEWWHENSMEPHTVHKFKECRRVESLRALIPTARATKSCYILGRSTIEQVANEGQLETETVAFVAADELFHKNPYDKARIVSCECGQALLDWMPDCHMCGRKRLRALTPAAPEAAREEKI